MQNQDIREYFSRIGIQKITRLDTALLEAFGKEEGERHIERLDELFGRSEERLLCGTGGTPPGGACGVYEPEPEDEPSGGLLL